jgi:hypothetical protein
MEHITEACWEGYKQEGMKDKNGRMVPNCVPVKEVKGGMAKNMSVEDIAKKHEISVDEIKAELKIGMKVEKEHTDSHKEAVKIAKDHLVEDPKYYTKLKDIETPTPVEELGEGEYCNACLAEYIREHANMLQEAEYQGRKVSLGKPMQGDVKKFKVFVKDPKTGNVKKVNFGDKTMRIKKSNPKRRKSFRARHNCDNPGPRTKARYWSCRKW